MLITEAVTKATHQGNHVEVSRSSGTTHPHLGYQKLTKHMCLYASHGPAGGGAGQFLALYQHGAGSALRRCPAEQRPPALRSGRANTNTSAPHSQPRGRCLGRGPQPALGASMPGRPRCSRVRGPWAGAEATKRGGRARLPPCRPVRARGRSRAPPAAWAPHRQTALTGQGDGHPPPFPPALRRLHPEARSRPCPAPGA